MPVSISILNLLNILSFTLREKIKYKIRLKPLAQECKTKQEGADHLAPQACPRD